MLKLNRHSQTFKGLNQPILRNANISSTVEGHNKIIDNQTIAFADDILFSKHKTLEINSFN